MDPTVAAMTKRNELRMVDSLMSQEFTAQVGEFHTNQMVHLNRHEHVAIILHYAKERAKKEGHGVQRNKIIAEEDTVDDELDPVQKHLNDLLNEATKKGDIEMLEHRIDEGAHVNAHDEDEWTPLHWAAEHHKEEAALALLRHGAKPNAVTDLDQTPLHFAAKFNAPGMIHALIEHGADVDAKDENERTALDISSEYGWEEVHDIIEAAVNQKRKDENLISAAENGDDGGVEDVLASGADVHTVDKEKCWTALHWAASQGRPHMMEILLDYKSDPNAVDNEGCTPLHIVAETDKVNLATLLLKKGAQLEARDRVLMTPLHRSVQKGIDDMVQLFVERNADVNAKDRVGRTPLHLAAKEGHESASGEGWVGSDGDGIVSLLLSRGVHVDELDRGLRTPLHWAAAGGHDDVVKLLLGNQATVDLRDRKGMFASDLAVQKGHDSAAAPIKAAMAQKTRNISLLDAARQGDKSLVTDMLEEGAEVNFKDTKSRSALQLATRNGHETVVRAVLDVQSCDVDSRNDIGHTSLHLACAGGYSVIARMLLDRGADVEAQDPKDGWTPLFEAVYAATDAHVEVVQVLLRGGALLKAVSTNGLQPIHLASECGHEGMLKFLLDHGKDYCADYDLVSATTAVSQWEPLSFAAEKGRLGAVYALIKHGANVNAAVAGGSTALHHAASAGHTRVVRALLKNGAEVDAKGGSEEQYTPLHLAAGQSHLDVVVELIKRGADVSPVEGSMGWTALHVAAVNCHDSSMQQRQDDKAGIIRHLIDAGADPEAIDRSGRSALHLTAERGLLLSTETLLKCGAQVDSEDPMRRTPLHYAAMSGYLEACILLLKNFANKRHMDDQGRNTLVIAEKYGHSEVLYELNKRDW